jgi:cell fate regulator YaaT (PSP1 superfamily)
VSATAEGPCPAQPRLARVVLSGHLPGQVFQLSDEIAPSPGVWVVVRCDEGERLGRLATHELPIMRPCAARIAGAVLRLATAEELARGQQLAAIEREALAFCRQRAHELGLPIRPVAAVAPLEHDLLVISFAAEERVDFRELLRDMMRRLRRRVELRQVGVRDQAKSAGGWGPCGRPLCCATFMSRFSSVTIRMAKAQKLSLNPSRISGMCGRLMCCLAHEAEPGGGKERREPRQQTPSSQRT